LANKINMTDEKWENIIYQIEEKFGILKREKEEIEVGESFGKKIKGLKETVEFKGPLGKIKLERISRPKIAEKKVISSKRIGGKVAIDYIYSPEELVKTLKVYAWDEATNNWKELKTEILGSL